MSRGYGAKAVRVGMRIEAKEHFAKPGLARKIALNHLAENPNYYYKLRRAGL